MELIPQPGQRDPRIASEHGQQLGERPRHQLGLPTKVDRDLLQVVPVAVIQQDIAEQLVQPGVAQRQ